jgi:hypothetical protein
MAFLRVSESALRLGAVGGPGAGAGGASVVLFEEKSRLMVARPERGCRSRCITSSDDERNVQDAATVTHYLSECPSGWSRGRAIVQLTGEPKLSDYLRPCPSSVRPRGRVRRPVLSER